MAELAHAALTQSSIPYARNMLGLQVSQLALVARVVSLLFRIAHSRPYQERVDEGADGTCLHDPGTSGVFMGYDFHLTEEGPRLIEINTNAGGALLNGLHTAALCEPERLDWLCCDPPPVALVEDRIVRSFRSEFEAVRGGKAALRTVAIADEHPHKQFLYPEFELFRQLFARHGIAARICDTAELQRDARGGIALDGTAIDLVYLRDTDFRLASERVAALRDAYVAGTVVLTPSPREHHLLADKRRLALFSSAKTLEGLSVPPEDAGLIAEIVPETRSLRDMSFEEAWRTRRAWVFKPAAAFGSRAVYRGDKISRRRLEEIYGSDDFIAQRRVDPGLTMVDTPDGPRQMKFDVRAYAYRDEILLLGARVYEGQVTNFRTPGGGFSAICVAKDGAIPGAAGAAACCPTN
jgi:hypothetical protein